MKTYFFTFLCSTFLALVITPVIIRLAERMNLMDFLNPRKIHSRPIPRIGGIAIFVSATVPVLTAMFLDNAIGMAFRSVRLEIITMLAAGAFIFTVGLIDDLRGLGARYKLLSQAVAAIAICVVGVRIEFLEVPNLFMLNFGIFAIPVTVFWVISVTNAVNLIDGLDGLAAGICAVVCAIIGIFAFSNGQLLMAVFMLSLLGSLCGFLFFNFNPARIFMGDSGSMFLGFILASTSVMCAIKSQTVVALALPTVALGLPIFDTFFSIIRRYLSRWQIMSADRGHLHHRLLDMGLRHRHVVVIMYAITVIAAGLGMFMMITRGGGTVVVFVGVLLLLTLVFRAVGVVKLHELVRQVKSNRQLVLENKEQKNIFEYAHLRFNRAASFKEWWRLVCESAEKAGFSELYLTAISSSGREHLFKWTSPERISMNDEFVSMRLPISEGRFDVAMHVEARIPVNGLLESAGRKMMLLGRLIDDFSGSQALAEGTGVPIRSVEVKGSEKPAETVEETDISVNV